MTTCGFARPHTRAERLTEAATAQIDAMEIAPADRCSRCGRTPCRTMRLGTWHNDQMRWAPPVCSVECHTEVLGEAAA
jgi:hypothetical protein